MFRRRAARDFAAWIACIAVLMAALAPAISQAVATRADGPQGWTEVCTTQGMQRILIQGAPALPDAPAPEHFSFEHCPFCLTHAGVAVLPPVPIRLPASVGRDSLPALFLDAPRPLFAWLSAPSRAPPFTS